MCLLPQAGKGCSIEGMGAVTEANFCPWSVTTPSNSFKTTNNATAGHSPAAAGGEKTGGGGFDEDDHENEEEEKEREEEKARSKAACNRMQDFRSLVERAEYEHNKELIEGHIRSNSLVFNTFIYLQVGPETCSTHCISTQFQ